LSGCARRWRRASWARGSKCSAPAQTAEEASFSSLLHYPSPQDPWAGYGVLQAKFKTVVRGTPADVTWLRKQVKAELDAWADPARRRVSQGRRPQ
jgi:hypothetical protein